MNDILLHRYVDALQSEQYVIQLTHLTEKPIRVIYDRAALLRAAGYLRFKVIT